MFYRKQVVPFDTPALLHERLAHRLAVLEIKDESKVRFPKLTSKNFEKVTIWERTRIEEMKALILKTYDAKTIQLMLDTGMRPAGY